MAAAGEDHSSGSEAKAATKVRAIEAASVALIRGDTVLLVERGTGGAAGLWSLPGGHVEAGETAEEAARRELVEETGLVAGMLRPLAIHEPAYAASEGAATTGYVIQVFFGRAPATGEPAAASDARTARFVPIDALDRLPLTDGALSLIRRAHAMIGKDR